MKNKNSDQRLSIRNVIASSNLPKLIGSLPDITWANRIRIDLLLAANEQIAILHLLVRKGESADTLLRESILAVRRLRDGVVATWWIAHRDRDIVALLQELTHRSYTMEYGRD